MVEKVKTAPGQAKPQKSGREGKPAVPVSSIVVSDGKETPHPVPRLKKYYEEKIVPDFIKKQSLENKFEVPRLLKVVVNMGVSQARENVQVLDSVREELAMVVGQWPQVRKSQKSISNFKLREGMPIGLRVTLRGDRMWEFLDRLISTAIPRIRDFRGLEPRGFDGRGNYNLGLREQMIFPEINMEKSLGQQGMNISLVTTAGRDDWGFDFLTALGFPFKKSQVPSLNKLVPALPAGPNIGEVN
jgi:large subunit ribosomal protein L5